MTRNEYQRTWRQNNRERLNANRRAYYHAKGDYMRKQQNDYRARDKEKSRADDRKRARRAFLLSLGMTEDDYKRMLFQQKGGCWICGAKPELHKSSTEAFLVVDHEHATKSARGLLCGKCNKGLGLFNDNPDLLVNAIAYLTQNAKETAA